MKNDLLKEPVLQQKQNNIKNKKINLFGFSTKQSKMQSLSPK